jgi:hypothetical protein
MCVLYLMQFGILFFTKHFVILDSECDPLISALSLWKEERKKINSSLVDVLIRYVVSLQWLFVSFTSCTKNQNPTRRSKQKMLQYQTILRKIQFHFFFVQNVTTSQTKCYNGEDFTHNHIITTNSNKHSVVTVLHTDERVCCIRKDLSCTTVQQQDWLDYLHLDLSTTTTETKQKWDTIQQTKNE